MMTIGKQQALIDEVVKKYKRLINEYMADFQVQEQPPVPTGRESVMPGAR